ICVAKHLAPYLPGHPVVRVGGEEAIGPIAAAPWGSASILLISWAYIRLMGGDALTQATKIATLNANSMATRLGPHVPALHVGKGAPHTAEVLTADSWDRPYSRQHAAFPLPWVRTKKFWPAVGRLNAVLGDRQLICSCPPIEDYAA